jgi:hypothetical protein
MHGKALFSIVEDHAWRAPPGAERMETFQTLNKVGCKGAGRFDFDRRDEPGITDKQINLVTL